MNYVIVIKIYKGEKMNDILSEPKETKYIESKQSANTLFKFTNKIEYLKEIIKNGAIIPRYNEEDISYLKLTMIDNIIAFPMICFCDINLTKLILHAKGYEGCEGYGSFGIGIKKKWAYDNINIEPIHYVNPNSSEIKDYKIAFSNALSKTKKETEKISNYLSTTLLYMKPIIGEMKNKKGKPENHCFHDEREWRFIPYINEEDVNLIIKGDMLTDEYKELANNVLRAHRKYWLKFSPGDINYIIVENEDEAVEIAEYIRGIKGKYDKNQKLQMISKILILNNLEKDG